MLLSSDTADFDDIQRQLVALCRVAPNSVIRVSLEAALRSLTSAPVDYADTTATPIGCDGARRTLDRLVLLVSRSQWRFAGHDRRRLTICAMWLRTAQRYWQDLEVRTSASRDHFLFRNAS